MPGNQEKEVGDNGDGEDDEGGCDDDDDDDDDSVACFWSLTTRRRRGKDKQPADDYSARQLGRKHLYKYYLP